MSINLIYQVYQGRALLTNFLRFLNVWSKIQIDLDNEHFYIYFPN